MTDDELNAAIAGEGLGLLQHPECTCWLNATDESVVEAYEFHPATDANDALRVVEAMRERAWQFRIVAWINEVHKVVFERPPNYSGYLWADADCSDIFGIPRAICEAALKAVRG